MPQSLASVYLHVVFSTKNRGPQITSEIVPRLYQYLAATALGNETKLLDIGGMLDHVHLLLSFGRTVSVADTVKTLKGGSSRWVHDTFGDSYQFAWQTGYGVFSVGYPELGAVRNYIATQAEHQGETTYGDELRTMLTQHGKKWDERFVWD